MESARYTPDMRVIAGIHRGRNLDAPPGRQTRPILDRVKTALFDWLGSRLAMPGELPAIRVLDLFCGGGSMGIECLSRGAKSCAFVDQDAEAIRCLRANLDALRIGPDARIHHAPAEYVRFPERDDSQFDVIFLDPPYAMSESLEPGGDMMRLLERLGKEIGASPGALLIWRHDSKTLLPDSLPNDWTRIDQRSYGGMTLSIYQFAGGDA
ncbi:MAG: 16S rRNA (guanine(966)-N(2))-methyltransferase RsmD [Planctomycetes bacterium]|nr:16S rRNA (guanine(966)-N(2))-methyltransferase RsmD [Planctomycetota bacterium]